MSKKNPKIEAAVLHLAETIAEAHSEDATNIRTWALFCLTTGEFSRVASGGCCCSSCLRGIALLASHHATEEAGGKFENETVH